MKVLEFALTGVTKMEERICRIVIPGIVSPIRVRMTTIQPLAGCLRLIRRICWTGEAEVRMNTPSTLGNNWKWRAREGSFSDELAARLRHEMEIY